MLTLLVLLIMSAIWTVAYLQHRRDKRRAQAQPTWLQPLPWNGGDATIHAQQDQNLI